MNFTKCRSMLSEKDDQVRLFASRKLLSLTGLSSAEISDVSSFLDDSNPEVRILLVTLMRKYPYPETQNRLLSRLEKESNPRVRSLIYRVLPLTGGDKIFPVLHNGFNDIDFRVRANSVEALEFFSSEKTIPVLNQMLRDTSPRVKTAALSVLSKTEPERVKNGIFELYSETKDFGLKTALLHLMGKIRNPEFIPVLVTALDSLDTGIRKMAVRSLGNYHDREITQILIQRFYEEKNTSILKEITSSFTEDRDFVVDTWFYSMPEDVSSTVRANIARTLGILKAQNSLNLLLKLINDPDHRVRANALESLEKHRDSSHLVNLILPYLSDSHPRVKAAAASALWKMGILNAAQTLKNMLKETNELVQKSAAFVLSSLGIF